MKFHEILASLRVSHPSLTDRELETELRAHQANLDTPPGEPSIGGREPPITDGDVREANFDESFVEKLRKLISTK
jgi:hypothetical protein